MISDELTDHPYAACYPLISGALEGALLTSIKENGLRQPVVLWRDEARGKTWLIDGRNRYRALLTLQGGLKEEQVVWQTYADDEAVRLAVLDYNENRRQMSTAQKSVVAGRILEARAALLSVPVEPAPVIEALVIEATQEPQTEERHEQAELPVESPAEPSTETPSPIKRLKAEDCPPQVKREVAATLGIGARTAQKGAAVVTRGAPKLVSALEGGEVSLEAAYTLAQLDDEALEQVVAQGKEVMREKARELKGLAKAEKEQAKREALLGEREVERLSISWEEVRGGVRSQHHVEVSDADQLYTLLSTLKRFGLVSSPQGEEGEGAEEQGPPF